MFLFKKKPLVVDAFITEQYSHAYDYAPIDYANKFYPDWWRALPKTEFDWDIMGRANQSMRACPGFTEHLNHGLIIPMWSELALKTIGPEEWRYQFSDLVSVCETHDASQRAGFYTDYTNIKIMSPWFLRSEQSVYWNYQPAFWNSAEPPGYQVAPGTVDYYYQNSTHINLLVPPEQRILIPVGQPMAHIVPLTERPVELRRHLVTESEFKRIFIKKTSFTNHYYKFKKILDKREAGKSKCPFSWPK